jgi:hypothetical protein
MQSCDLPAAPGQPQRDDSGEHDGRQPSCARYARHGGTIACVCRQVHHGLRIIHHGLRISGTMSADALSRMVGLKPDRA